MLSFLNPAETDQETLLEERTFQVESRNPDIAEWRKISVKKRKGLYLNLV